MNFEEQIMSKDKYPSIFSRQMETIVFSILRIFFVTRALLELGIPKLVGNIQSRDVFRPIVRERKHLQDN